MLQAFESSIYFSQLILFAQTEHTTSTFNNYYIVLHVVVWWVLSTPTTA